MPTSQLDTRSEHRRTLDEQLASEPHLSHSEATPGKQPQPLEAHLRPRRPLAVAGVVENGLIRLLDPDVTLPEHSRVIVVTSDPS